MDFNEKLAQLPDSYPEMAMRTNRDGKHLIITNSWWKAFQVAMPAFSVAANQADRFKAALVYGEKLREAGHPSLRGQPGRRPSPETLNMLHAVLGLYSEAGELLECLFDSMMTGTKLDTKNMVEEAGDIRWFLTLLEDALEVSDVEVMTKNLKKLKKRFPEGFSESDAVNRDKDAELKAMDDE